MSSCALCRKQSTCWSRHCGFKLPFCSERCSELVCSALISSSAPMGLALIGGKPGEDFSSDPAVQDLIRRLELVRIDWGGKGEARGPRGAATMEPPTMESALASRVGRTVEAFYATWDSLPIELRLMIISGVPILDAVKDARVTRRWRNLLNNDDLWATFYRRSVVDHLGGTDKLLMSSWRQQTVAYLCMFDFAVRNKITGAIERVIPLDSLPAGGPVMVVEYSEKPGSPLVLRNRAALVRNLNAIKQTARFITYGQRTFRVTSSIEEQEVYPQEPPTFQFQAGTLYLMTGLSRSVIHTGAGMYGSVFLPENIPMLVTSPPGPDGKTAPVSDNWWGLHRVHHISASILYEGAQVPIYALAPGHLFNFVIDIIGPSQDIYKFVPVPLLQRQQPAESIEDLFDEPESVFGVANPDPGEEQHRKALKAFLPQLQNADAVPLGTVGSAPSKLEGQSVSVVTTIRVSMPTVTEVQVNGATTVRVDFVGQVHAKLPSMTFSPSMALATADYSFEWLGNRSLPFQSTALDQDWFREEAGKRLRKAFPYTTPVNFYVSFPRKQFDGRFGRLIVTSASQIFLPINPRNNPVHLRDNQNLSIITKGGPEGIAKKISA